MLLILAAVLPHLGALRTFLFFDSALLRNDPMVRDASAALRQLGRSWYVPGQDLAILTFAWNRAANVALGRGEFDAAGFVLVNIVLHAVATCLVFVMARGLLARADWPEPSVRGAAFIAATLFAAHPLHASSVAYVVQRRGLLCSVFYLTALCAWLARNRATTSGRRRAWALIVLVAGWVCIKSKSMGTTLPLALLAMEYCLRAADGAARRRFLRICAGLLLAWFVAVAGFLYSQDLLHLRTLRSPTAAYESVNWGPLENALSEMRVLARYARLMLLPLPGSLSIDPEFSPTISWMDVRAVVCLLLHVAVLMVALRAAARGWTALAFGTLLFYLAQLPWLFIPQPVLLAEYKTYLSATGAAMALAEVLARAQAALTRRVVLAGGGALVLLLAFWTVQRNEVFRNPVTLWHDVVTKSPDRFRGRFNLGNALYNEGRYDEAIEQYRAAARLDPPEFRPHYNMGNALMKLGRSDEAIQSYLEALRRHPEHEGSREALRRAGYIAVPRSP